MTILKRNGLYPIEMAKLSGVGIDLLSKIAGIGLFRNYASVYPPAHSDTYVKATSYAFEHYYATNPAKSLTGSWATNQWLTGSKTNQRFHIDLGSAKIVKRIYYENTHNYGGDTTESAKNFTFWGSNTGAGTFDDLTYANDEGWTQLTISQSTFDQHIAADQADPKYILVTNTTAYRYYAFKFADNWGGANYLGVRRIELQELAYVSVYPPAHNATYVKATTEHPAWAWPYDCMAYQATDPAKSLVGIMFQTCWASADYTAYTDQRFHIDLGTSKIIKRIYYENGHYTGDLEECGVYHFTFWGSNSATAFSDLVYSHDTDWTQITTAQSIFDAHIAVDQADPKYILVTNTIAYRYYAFKFADNRGLTNFISVRRIELQTLKIPYVSVYPSSQNGTYVKATTSRAGGAADPFEATDPAKSLINDYTDAAWMSLRYTLANQRFHIDLGSAQIVKRIYYQNFHATGDVSTIGVENFTLWGSNEAGAFAELTYATDTNWTQLICAQSTFDQHVAANQVDPKYILVINTTPYRYYAFKFADNYGSDQYIGLRRIELQVIG